MPALPSRESARVAALRVTALAAAVFGAAGSVAFLLRAGNRNSELFLLVAMFSLWVASPFGILVLAIFKSARWPPLPRMTLYGVTLVISVASLAIYSRFIDVKPEGSPNTFLFVAVPPLSWMLTGVSITTAALLSRRRP